MNLKTVCSKGTKYTGRKRIARGPGSGLGKTAGRGHKGWGQRSGARRRPGYEGGQMPIYRRVPKRGFTNARFRTEYTVINVGELGAFDDGASVDLDAVLAHGLTSKVTPLFKVLGNGDLTRKLTVRAQKFSKSAVVKIQQAGGTVVNIDERGNELSPEALAALATPPKPKVVKGPPAKTAVPEGDATPEKGAKGAKGEKPAKAPKGEKPADGEKPAKGSKPQKDKSGDKPDGGDNPDPDRKAKS